jgi:hypothetical protein
VRWWTNPLGRYDGLGMRLRSKIFLASALMIAVLAVVSALSLGAVGGLVSANREITTRTIPTLSLTASAREAIPALMGLEARAVVLGDQRYATAWTTLAARTAEDLERLATYALTEREALHLREASAGFEEYRRIVAEEHALLQRRERAGAMRLTDTSRASAHGAGPGQPRWAHGGDQRASRRSAGRGRAFGGADLDGGAQHAGWHRPGPGDCAGRRERPRRSCDR